MTIGVWLSTDTETGAAVDAALEERTLQNDAPRGLLLHIAASDHMSWHIVEVWDSAGGFRDFLADVLEADDRVAPQQFSPHSVLQFTTIEEDATPVALLLRLGGDKGDLADALVEQLSLPGWRMPDGGRFHVAGVVEDEWRAIQVWETRRAFDTIFEDKLQRVLTDAESGLKVEQLEPRNVLAFTDVRQFLGL
jgi:hypothetical protein